MIAGTLLLPLRGAGRPAWLVLSPSPAAGAELPGRRLSLRETTPTRVAQQLPERPRTRLRLSAPHLALHLAMGLCDWAFFKFSL